MSTTQYVWEPGDYPVVQYRVLWERGGFLLLIDPRAKAGYTEAFWCHRDDMCTTRLEALETTLEQIEDWNASGLSEGKCPTARIKRAIAREKRKAVKK